MPVAPSVHTDMTTVGPRDCWLCTSLLRSIRVVLSVVLSVELSVVLASQSECRLLYWRGATILALFSLADWRPPLRGEGGMKGK